MSEHSTEKQTLGFQTEVSKLLHLMIHSLYSNPEIFLRELISNASDAADKLRFEALSHPEWLAEDAEPRIVIDVDKEARTITLRDNGIGMSRQEIIENLGTIARSGTADFLSNLSGDQKKDSQLIGQFGVGFYSAFVVAERVEVVSRRAGATAEQAVRWESQGEGSFTVEDAVRETRGTTITLHLRPQHDEFADSTRLQGIIHKYAEHIAIPVCMRSEKWNADSQSMEQGDYETINKAAALWTRPRNEISEDEYRAFYQHISHDYEPPLSWTHNRVEGNLEYTALLYLPKRAPTDLYHRDGVRGLKLYVQRVFIMDDAEQFLPLYLRFIKGVVDSNDLPLNVSRELLQSGKVVDTMKSALARRALDMLLQLAESKPEDYTACWAAFGNVLKEGIAEDHANQEKLLKLLRFASTHGDAAQTVALADYVARMKEGQEKIYYLIADSHTAASQSPHLEVFRKKGVEVLLLSERIDEWLMSHLTEFDGKEFQNIAKGDLDLGNLTTEEDRKAEEQLQEASQPLVERLQQVLGERVQAVKATQRLTDSPACLVRNQYDLGAAMRQILEASGQKLPDSKPTLEVNPQHPLMSRLATTTDSERFEALALVVLDQATLAEGSPLTDPAGYVRRVNSLLGALS